MTKNNDSTRVPTTADAIAHERSTEADRVALAARWINRCFRFGITAMATGLLTVIILASLLTRGPIPDYWRQTVNALGLALFIAGVATACSGLIMSSARRHIQIAKLDQAAQTFNILSMLSDVLDGLTAIRDGGAKRIEELHGQIDELRSAGGHWSVDDVQGERGDVISMNPKVYQLGIIEGERRERERRNGHPPS